MVKKIVKPAVVAVLILTLISGYALFFKPLVGLADNGDFYRVMLSNDLNYEAERNKNDYYGFFNHKYQKLQYFNDLHGNIISTQNIVITTAKQLDDLITQDDKFDIRFLAFLCLIIVALGLFWFVEVIEKFTKNTKLKYFFACFAVFIFGDIGYIAYFNSFYGESIAFSFFILSIAALLKFSTDKDHKFRYLIVFAFASVMFIGSKNQYSPNGMLTFIILLLIIFTDVDLKKKILAVSLGVVVLFVSGFMYLSIDDNIYLINKYHMMTRGVMLFEPDVESITKEIGMDEQYALLSETIYYDMTPLVDPRDETLLADFYSNYNVASITMYYLTHPEAFSKMMNFGWKNSFTIRPEILGNFERSAEMEYGRRTNFFSIWSHFKGNIVPKYSGFAYMFLLICLALGINRFIENKKQKIPFYIEMIFIYVFLTGFSQIFVSFVGAGDADLRKHLFMNTLALDILFYFNFTYVLSIFFRKEKV